MIYLSHDFLDNLDNLIYLDNLNWIRREREDDVLYGYYENRESVSSANMVSSSSKYFLRNNQIITRALEESSYPGQSTMYFRTLTYYYLILVVSTGLKSA